MDRKQVEGDLLWGFRQITVRRVTSLTWRVTDEPSLCARQALWTLFIGRWWLLLWGFSDRSVQAKKYTEFRFPPPKSGRQKGDVTVRYWWPRILERPFFGYIRMFDTSNSLLGTCQCSKCPLFLGYIRMLKFTGYLSMFKVSTISWVHTNVRNVQQFVEYLRMSELSNFLGTYELLCLSHST